MSLRNNWTRRDAWIAGALFALCAVVRLPLVGVSYLTLHSARDIYRALELIGLGNVPLAGPELYFGGQVPGNFYYILQSIPLLFWRSPWAVAAWMALLASAAGPIAYFALRRLLPSFAAVVAICIYALFPLTVVEGIYVWNPCYLPFLISLSLLALTTWIATGRRIYWSMMLLVGLLAIQVHLSAYIILIVAVFSPAIRLWLRRSEPSEREPERLTLASVLWPFAAVLPFCIWHLWEFSPFYFLDISLPDQGDRTVGMFSLGLNRSALGAFQRALIFEDDTFARQGFIHFSRFFQLVGESSPTLLYILRDATHIVSFVSALIYFPLGLALAALAVCGPRRVRDRLCVAAAPPSQIRLFASVLLLWFAVPLIPLMKMTSAHDGAEFIGIPTRYFIIYYPLLGIFQGIGAYFLFACLMRKNRLAAIVSVIPLVLALAFYAFFNFMFMASAYRSGTAMEYLHNSGQFTKPLFVESALSDVLAGYGVDLDDFRERVLTDGEFTELHAEQYLDYPLFYDLSKMPGAPDDLWFYLWNADELPEMPPAVRASGEVVAVHAVKHLRLAAIRRAEPSRPVVWPVGQLEPIGIR